MNDDEIETGSGMIAGLGSGIIMLSVLLATTKGIEYLALLALGIPIAALGFYRGYKLKVLWPGQRKVSSNMPTPKEEQK
jgi:hypothetical protein